MESIEQLNDMNDDLFRLMLEEEMCIELSRQFIDKTIACEIDY